jgi:hypothetical protein
MEQRWRAQHGQLAPAQRKLAELEAQLREARAASEQAKPKQPDRLDRYREEFPEEARLIEEALSPLQQQLSKAEQRLEEQAKFIENERGRREAEAAKSEVLRVHEDFEQIDKSPEFDAWLKAVSEVDANGNPVDPIMHGILSKQRVSGAEGVWLVTQYKRDLALAEMHGRMQQGQPVTVNPATQQRRETAKQDLPVRQTRQSSSNRRPNVATDEAEAAFAAFLQQSTTH